MKAGLSFASGLRSMVRSDPDVLMVGEIRDRETAQIAVESALTGHLVLSTLHTNRAPMAPARLIEMGIEPFLVASAVSCIVAQRLARRLCADCREPIEVSALELEQSGLPGPWESFEGYKPVGCMRCEGTGYHGRIGLYEVMKSTDEIQSMILGKASAEEIHASSMASGLRGLQVDGLEKVRDGITTLPEVLRVVGS
jgi:type IV pilus assembly protein PilB